jgi:AP-3 complex subunit sigma
MAIRAALIFNNHGKPRLTRFYSQLPITRQQALIQRIFALVNKRIVGNDGREVCNFLDAPELRPLLPPPSQVYSTTTVPSSSHKAATTTTSSSNKDGANGDADQLRVIYRHYATLFFVFVVDESESELGILDLIQVCGDIVQDEIASQTT